MSFSAYQIFIPLLSFIMLMYALSSFRRGAKTIKEMIVWTLFWGGFAFVAIYPEVTLVVTRLTGFQNNVNALVFMGMGVMFFVLLKLLIIVENLQYTITRLVRYDAIGKFEAKKTENDL